MAAPDFRREQIYDLKGASSYFGVLIPLAGRSIILLLSKKMAILVDHGIATLGVPQALSGFGGGFTLRLEER